jgi:hypothetical protein
MDDDIAMYLNLQPYTLASRIGFRVCSLIVLTARSLRHRGFLVYASELQGSASHSYKSDVAYRSERPGHILYIPHCCHHFRPLVQTSRIMYFDLIFSRVDSSCVDTHSDHPTHFALMPIFISFFVRFSFVFIRLPLAITKTIPPLS